MLPRTKVDSDPVAMATMERIGRSLNKRQRKGLPWGVVAIALVVVFGWLAWPRTPNADPLGDARLNNAQATPTPAPAPAVSVPAPRAELVRLNPNVPRAAIVRLGTPVVPTKVQMGDTFWVQMPDQRWIVANAMSRANRLEELPLTGNRIGDARWIGEHCFVWLNPIGQMNPTWIDP